MFIRTTSFPRQKPLWLRGKERNRELFKKLVFHGKCQSDTFRIFSDHFRDNVVPLQLSLKITFYEEFFAFLTSEFFFDPKNKEKQSKKPPPIDDDLRVKSQLENLPSKKEFEFGFERGILSKTFFCHCNLRKKNIFFIFRAFERSLNLLSQKLWCLLLSSIDVWTSFWKYDQKIGQSQKIEKTCLAIKIEPGRFKAERGSQVCGEVVFSMRHIFVTLEQRKEENEVPLDVQSRKNASMWSLTPRKSSLWPRRILLFMVSFLVSTKILSWIFWRPNFGTT